MPSNHEQNRQRSDSDNIQSSIFGNLVVLIIGNPGEGIALGMEEGQGEHVLTSYK